MKTRMFTFLLSLAIGIAVTAVLTAAASFCFDVGAELATRFLSWPNTLLQSLVPPLNIGTAEKAFYEGTPLNILAYLASLPLSVSVYSAVAYVFLRKRWLRSEELNGAAAKDTGK